MFNFGPVRLSFITPRLIRFEYDPAEAFEDRETFAVVNRSFRGFPGTLAPCLFLKGGREEGFSIFVPSEVHRGKAEECKEEWRESKP